MTDARQELNSANRIKNKVPPAACGHCHASLHKYNPDLMAEIERLRAYGEGQRKQVQELWKGIDRLKAELKAWKDGVNRVYDTDFYPMGGSWQD